ncbi:cytochrome P450 710A11-like [Vigna angularis]|uniref:cytochrome P450 710A11-like n=1 Tax=Phaseolus angularis TaxID=3914 RepID=UPI0022B5DD67|nr:cytochrome P450 710A11-like [Vigna angularis]
MGLPGSKPASTNPRHCIVLLTFTIEFAPWILHSTPPPRTISIADTFPTVLELKHAPNGATEFSRQAQICSSVDRLIKTLATYTEMSKTRMQKREDPSCLIDCWMQETLKEIEEAKLTGEPVTPFSADSEIGGYLFVAQDESTSSLLWVVVREVVRFRSPATLVPHIAAERFALTESYTIPKGTIVFPSTFESAFQWFHQERFSKKRQEDQVFENSAMDNGGAKVMTQQQE